MGLVKMREMIINCETGEKTFRDLTLEEIENSKEFDRKNDERLAKRQEALNKLQALGLTEEDLRAIGL